MFTCQNILENPVCHLAVTLLLQAAMLLLFYFATLAYNQILFVDLVVAEYEFW